MILIGCFSFPGFVRLRMHTKGGSPVSFVEFTDVRYASQALQGLNGFMLPSNDRGGLRIEYAKTKMADSGIIIGKSMLKI